MTSPAQDPARLARRRREHERQAVIFGVLVALLLLVGLGALAVYTGAIDAPFARDFTTAAASDDATAPCLPAIEDQPDGALPVPASEVHVRILNASGATGIAKANQTVLEKRGFIIDSVGNYATTLARNELRFGAQGIVAAYTLAAHFPQIRLVLDAREDATVDLLVGEKYDEPLGVDDVTLASDTPLTNMAGCKPADQLTPLPAPSPEEAEDAGSEPADEGEPAPEG
ncbi:LytR C-terminal domain-containing protein [Xylanimonas ulmi]|uniref:LytR cell envelope-related transcriptional attenuator n=1 Tax=Xylanimonas ulmi TaxID=228973 RepID=A0A4Q7M843_9MICO|nr:LytR C-terminal domain-containing protein [Xylanibacterium ulmi]RZS62868.1 LytR cell envelope-related transcriptional attenuator [Xylanibacterium ulmi]